MSKCIQEDLSPYQIDENVEKAKNIYLAVLRKRFVNRIIKDVVVVHKKQLPVWLSQLLKSNQKSDSTVIYIITLMAMRTSFESFEEEWTQFRPGADYELPIDENDYKKYRLEAVFYEKISHMLLSKDPSHDSRKELDPSRLIGFSKVNED